MDKPAIIYWAVITSPASIYQMVPEKDKKYQFHNAVCNIILFLSFLLFIDVVSSCAEKYLDKYRTLSKFNDDLGPAWAAVYS